MKAVAPAAAGIKLAAAGIKLVLPPVINKLASNLGGDVTPAEGKYLKIVVSYRIEELIRKVKHHDSAQSVQLLEKLQAASLELVDLFDKYEYEQLEKQVRSSSSNPIKKFIPVFKEKLESILPKSPSRDCLEKLLKFLTQVEKIEQLITSRTDTTQPKMEMASKVGTELALSGLFRVVSILDENFGGVIPTEQMKILNDFVGHKIEALTREAQSDDLVQLMPWLKELQAAAIELEDLFDLYEYDQIEKQVNSSSFEPIPKGKFLPTHLRDGLNKLLKVIERVENIRQSIMTSNSFVDFLVGEFHVARPVIKLALSDISRLVKMLGSKLERGTNYQEIFEQLKDVVSYHIQALIRNVNFDYLAQSVQLLDMLQAASLQLDQFNPDEFDYTQIPVSSSYPIPLEKFKPKFDGTKKQDVLGPDEYDYTQKQVSSSYSIPSEKFKPKIKEELGPILPKSPLRTGLENLLKVVEQEEKKHSITSWTDTTQPQGNTIKPTLRIGVEKWLKFVEQVENKHPFITSKKDYTFTPISTTFFPGRGFLSTTMLENDKCQKDVEEIMRNHKKNLKTLIFGWTNTVSSNGTCEEILERLEPDQNLKELSIVSYSCAKFPNWMVKENWLSCLQTLRLESCRNLKIVPFLPPHLQELVVFECDELMQLPPLSDTLCTLRLFDCPKLIVPSTFNKSPSLSDLRIKNCSRNENPLCIDASFLINLELLELAGLPNLQTITNLSPTLTNLVIEECPKLTSLENLHHCTSLDCLKILKCPMLMKEKPSWVEGVVEGDIANRFPLVKRIWIDEPFLVLGLVRQQAFCSTRFLSLTRLYGRFINLFDEHFHQFSSLTWLVLKDCGALPNLEKLSSLQDLHIENFPDVESLPNLPISLQSLRINGCPKLKEKYKEGGPLRNTISHIPYIRIY